MKAFKPAALCTLLLIATVQESLSQSEHGAWVDVVPMTRRLFGADDLQGLAVAVGWSSSTTSDGWRALIGLNMGQETLDSFGTEVNISTRDVDVRAGRRWRARKTDEDRPCWLNLGVDGLFRQNHIGSESNNLDFSSSNETTLSSAGLSAVLGIQCRLSTGFHLVTEARMDAVFTQEKTRVWDSFSGEFTGQDNGWNTQLSPPLQLMLVLDL